MISCPTDLKTIRRNILRGLSLIKVAVKIESGRESELDDPGMKERYRGWDQALDEAYYDYLESLPRKIRLALPFLHKQREELMTVLFKNTVTTGKRLRACLKSGSANRAVPVRKRFLQPKPDRFLSGAARIRLFRHALRKPTAFSRVPTKGTNALENGGEVRVRYQKDLHKRLSNRLLKPTWPDIDSCIDEAKKALDDLERSGVSEIVPTVEEIKGVIREVVGEYQRAWPIRAEEPDDPKHRVAKMVGNRRPWRGVPVDELRGRVFEVEPATREEALNAALHLMLESGVLEIGHYKWTGYDGEPTKSECYILGSDAQPAVGDATPLAGGITDKADDDQPTLADIPRYQRESGEWISAKDTAEHEGLVVATLKAYRKQPHCKSRAESGSLGIDRDGRMWRRKDTTPHAHILYFLPSLKKSSKK